MGTIGTIANVFRERSNEIPGVVGAVDGCHIPIKQPPGNANDFYNRKGVHSIILQGVCDHNAKFIDIFIGKGGEETGVEIVGDESAKDVEGWRGATDAQEEGVNELDTKDKGAQVKVRTHKRKE
ncbi:hypothetical protein RN001_001589 [Aquatica leii]|uniref:DDE Tnp4 domain-containing protein n=1 Tax=Aquatica leii TaxID=1421715 RepID=A0AAN7QMZ0_9COLE|nr:hypothetical protein RN001_001589 [Aquatica leii]